MAIWYGHVGIKCARVRTYVHAGRIIIIITRQMLSIVASGSDASHATVVNGFCTGGCERVVLDALLSPVQSQLLTCAAGCQRVVLDVLLSLLCSLGC